jgi:hypothetical protein
MASSQNPHTTRVRVRAIVGHRSPCSCGTGCVPRATC